MFDVLFVLQEKRKECERLSAHSAMMDKQLESFQQLLCRAQESSGQESERVSIIMFYDSRNSRCYIIAKLIDCMCNFYMFGFGCKMVENIE